VVSVQEKVFLEVVEVKPEFEKIVSLIDSLVQDGSVPRNVRAALSIAREKLSVAEDAATGVGGAIYALDEVSNDINLPMHARTMIWNILTELENIKTRK
jgi:hypothetical protein